MSRSSEPQSNGVILIRGGRVYQDDGDIDVPPIADILAIDGVIVGVRSGIADAILQGRSVPELRDRVVTEMIEARERLVIPGFVNAHYHSHDVLLKGCFEAMPLELWLLSALPPNYTKRSIAEIRARTLLGAIECLRGGITTVQDLVTVHPFDEEHVDTILRAYDDVGIRCVFALQVADMPGSKSIPVWDEDGASFSKDQLSGGIQPLYGVDIAQVVRDLVRTRRAKHPRITWALGPSSPERCSESLLVSLAELSRQDDLPIYTHIYESKATRLLARKSHESDEGSLIKYLDRVGMLMPQLSLAHSIWMSPPEMDRVQEAGANVILNPIGNLKTRSGIAPVHDYLKRRINMAIGCDNCSCNDAQNMFQTMKMFSCLPAVCTPEPEIPTAGEAMRAATIGGARTAGLERRIGILKPGMAADMSLLDLTDPSFVPLNSAARQIVFTESGRSVETVIVDGRVVVRDRKVMTINEKDLREEVEELMKSLRKEVEMVVARNSKILPYLLEARRRSWNADLGFTRYLDGSLD